ncbi:MAG: Nif3-like dinuclear metal center hexameric protein, partial [Candidatus Helarchaeales archaeon]
LNFKQFMEGLRETCRDSSEPLDFLKHVKIGHVNPEKMKKIQVRRVVLSLNLTKKILSEAIRAKADVILTQFLSDFWSHNLTDEILDLHRIILSEKLQVVQIPKSWIFCEDGALDSVAEALELKIEAYVNQAADDSGLFLGRICSPKVQPFKYAYFFDLIKNNLRLDHFRFHVGNVERMVNKILLVLHEPIQMNTIQTAKRLNADLILGTLLSHQMACACENASIDAIELTCYSLSVGVSKLATLLGIDLPEIEFIFSNPGPNISHI